MRCLICSLVLSYYPNLTTPNVPIPAVLVNNDAISSALTPLILTVQYCVTEPILASFITGYATLSTTPLIISFGLYNSNVTLSPSFCLSSAYIVSPRFRTLIRFLFGLSTWSVIFTGIELFI